MQILKLVGSVLLALLLSTTSVEAVIAPVTPVSDQVEVKTQVESIQDKITRYAALYNVKPSLLRSIIGCESSFNRYALNDNPGVEYSVGLAQINLLAHDITKEQAQDVDFSLNFAAKNISLGKAPYMWVTCYNKAINTP